MAEERLTIRPENMNLLYKVRGPAIYTGNPNGHLDSSNQLGPIHFAAMNEHDNVGLVEMLVKMGADVNLRDKTVRQSSALNLSAMSANQRIFKFLLNRGANINLVDSRGFSALHNAVYTRYENEFSPEKIQSRLAIVNELLNREIDVNAGTIENVTPLMLAAADYGTLEIVNRLLEAGADVHVKSTHNRTCLHACLFSHTRNIDIMIKLIKEGASIHDKDNDGRDAISFIIDWDNLSTEQKTKELKDLIKITTLVHHAEKINFPLDQVIEKGIEGMEELANDCYQEVQIMRHKTLSNLSTLCDFALRGEETDSILDEIFRTLMQQNFVIYRDILVEQFRKTYLVEKLCENGFYAYTNRGCIKLIEDVIYHFCGVISKEDIFNILVAYANSPPVSHLQ